jgi:hypothetical protein
MRTVVIVGSLGIIGVSIYLMVSKGGYTLQGTYATGLNAVTAGAVPVQQAATPAVAALSIPTLSNTMRASVIANGGN